MLIVADFDNQAFIIECVKKLIVVLIAAFSIITACMIYLIREGVSLRLGRVIDPTLMSVGEAEIARGIVSRLTPVFAQSKIVVFGIDKADPIALALVHSLQQQIRRDLNLTPEIVQSESNFTGCNSHCWVMRSPGDSTHLQPSDLIEKLELGGAKIKTISILRFDRNIEVPQHCEKEKRITIDCVTPLAVRDAKRKFKEDSPYFLMRSYNDQDYFLLLEQL